MSEKNTMGDDLGWDSPPLVATLHKSSFTEPELITDVGNHDPDDEFHHSADAELDDQATHEADKESGTEAVVGRGLNYPILAVFAVVSLAALGGAGWLVNKQFFKPMANLSREVMTIQAEPIKSPAMLSTSTNTVMESGAGKTEVSVFDEPGPLAVKAPAVAVSAALAIVDAVPPVAPAPPVLVASAAQANSVFVPPPSTYATPIAAPGTPTAQPKAYAAAVPPKSVAPAVEVAKPSTPVATGSIGPAVVVAPASKRSVKSASASASPRRVVARKKTSPRVLVAQRRGAKARVVAAKAASPVEEFVLPRGLSVRSIYPISGPNAQAWLADGNGKVEIVRVGDSLRSGPQVLSIRGERGEVITNAGLITTRGSTR